MTDPLDNPGLTSPESPPPKGRPLLAWSAIVLLILFIVLRALLSSAVHKEESTSNRMQVLALRFQGKYLLGAADLIRANKKDVYKQILPLNTGLLGQRLRFVVLAGEFAGPQEALQHLEQLQNKVKGDADERPLVAVLERLYRDYAQQQLAAPAVSAEERELLRERLGWFGQLALAPDGGPDTQARQALLESARRTFLTAVGGLTGIFVLGGAGLIGLCLFLSFLLSGRLRCGVRGPFVHGGIYAETFAVWILLFVGIHLATAQLPETRAPLLRAAVINLLTLVALGWPVLRGVPWRQVRQDVGLTWGRNPLLEPFLGLLSYAMAIPLVCIGALLMFALLTLQKALSNDPVAPPGHPLVGMVHGTDWLEFLQVVFLASVAAPLLEETFFRGVLYRHLRGASERFGHFASILLSAGTVSFFFAAIHPQGLVAIPVLMALAFAFNLVREWRGTLVPSMIAHGLNNFLVTLLLFTVLSS